MVCLQEYRWIKKTCKKLGEIEVNDPKAIGTLEITSVRVYPAVHNIVEVDIKFRGKCKRYNTMCTKEELKHLGNRRINIYLRRALKYSVMNVIRYFDITRDLVWDCKIAKITWCDEL